MLTENSVISRKSGPIKESMPRSITRNMERNTTRKERSTTRKERKDTRKERKDTNSLKLNQLKFEE